MTVRPLAALPLTLLLATLTAPLAARAPVSSTRRTIDPATGLAILTTTGSPGTAIFEVSNGPVTITKRVLLGRSMTTVVSSRGRLTFTIDRAGILVATSSGTVAARLARPEEMPAIVTALGRSPVTAQGAALLASLRLDPDTAAGQALALTKALLETAAGDQTGTLAVLQSVQPNARPHAVAVRFGGGPGDCWDAYSKDAIRAANDFVSCYNNSSWYNLLDRLGCSTLYDVEAEGDWLWYLNCVGSGAIAN
jgi:hypothetical protein